MNVYFIKYITADSTCFPVLADEPQLHKIELVDPNEVHLIWATKNMLHCKTLQFSLKYRSEHDQPDTWMEQIITNKDSTNTEHNFKLTNLRAYTIYTVSLRATSKLSDDSFWSNAANQTFRTLASAPECSPNLTVGAFEVYTSNGTTEILNIFWTELAARYRNGLTVQYRLDVNDSDYRCRSLSSHGGQCVRQVTGPHDRALTVQLLSVGENNQTAKLASEMSIPSAVDRLSLPLRLRLIVLAEDQHPVFAWHPPVSNTTILSYSLFWCRAAVADKCSDSLQSVVVNAAHTNYTPNSDPQSAGLVRFAVAANTLHSTSGMTWNQCRYTGNMMFEVSKEVHDEQVTLTFDDRCLGCFTTIRMLFCVKDRDNCTTFELAITATTGRQFSTGALRANTMYTVDVNAMLLHSGRTVPFSKQFEVKIGRNAADEKTAFVMAVALSGAGVLIVIVLLLCGFKCALDRVRNMSDIGVILPVALSNITMEMTKRTEMRPEPAINYEQSELLLRTIAPQTDVTAVAEGLKCDKRHSEVDVAGLDVIDTTAELQTIGYIRIGRQPVCSRIRDQGLGLRDRWRDCPKNH